MKQWKTIISIILIFALGALSGAIATHKIYRQKMENIIRDEPRAMREMMVQRLNSKLNLDAVQLEQVRAIVTETHAEMKSVRKKIRPEIEEVLSRSQAKIRAILRPEQLEKYDQILSERRKRHENDGDGR
jgi:ATP-dependent Zn protease